MKTTSKLVRTAACWLATTFSYLRNTIGTESKENYRVENSKQPYKLPMIGSNDSSTFLGIWHSSTLGVYSAFKNGPIIS
jgi:hypothetical protein